MTTEQKAKAWDMVKEAAHDCSNSKDWFIRREVKQASKDLFTIMCEAEVTVSRTFPKLGVTVKE